MIAGKPRLTRRELAAFLTEHGFPITLSTLSKMGMRKQGPPPDGAWGQRLLYDPAKALRWAKQRFQPDQGWEPAA